MVGTELQRLLEVSFLCHHETQVCVTRKNTTIIAGESKKAEHFVVGSSSSELFKIMYFKEKKKKDAINFHQKLFMQHLNTQGWLPFLLFNYTVWVNYKQL